MIADPLLWLLQANRALCRDNLAARGLIETLRPLLYSHAALTLPSLGRIFC